MTGLLPLHIPYAELAVTTNFSFLEGGSHPEELVAQAASLGLSGIGIADRNSVAGVVRAHVALREWRAENAAGTRDLRLAVGARLAFADGTPDILAYPRDRAAWGRLCRLLTLGKSRAPKGSCALHRDDLLERADGLQLIVLPRLERADEDLRFLPALAEASAGTWLAARAGWGRAPRATLARTLALAESQGLPAIAVGDVLYHVPERRPLQDVLTCIRHGTTLDAAGRRLAANAERHLEPAHEMARLFREAPGAIPETIRFLDGLAFSLDDLRYEYPEEGREGFPDPQAALAHYAWEGARRRFGEAIPEKVRAAIRHELALIAELAYAPYFLTVHDIVRFARSRGILAQGRGSAANSTVCFCLGITEVDPTKHDLLFERFVSNERKEPPDIDVDFEHERREEVMQYVYERYGRERAGLAASVITYRARSAVREVGKVFGLSEDAVSALSGSIWGWSKAAVEEKEVERLGMDPHETRLARVLALAQELSGFPRHLSQHTGGFVITRSRLDEVTPVAPAAMEDRTTVEWDKDDLEALGMLKIDLLALGMLSCLRRAFDLLGEHYDERPTLATIPAEDPRVYAMIQRADTLGVFQIESRAQMSMLPRLKPASFYDLVIEVAIVRPGPIQGDMVHPYLRRREGRERVSYPAPAPEHGPKDELERVLGKTLGVPLFQEQAMKIAIVAARFTPSEADRLRRAMATFRRVGTIGTFAQKMVEGMVARGYERSFAEHCFKQIEGFGEYGFPESHAASFALLVYASCWVKARYPDVFAAALLNAQPMGFYAPAQIVRDAREHGVEVRPPDVNASAWDCTLEPGPRAAERLHPAHASMRGDIRSARAVRLGLRTIKGANEAEMRRLAARRGAGYDSVRDLWLRTELPPATLERLAEADAFASLGLTRRDALWAVKALRRSGDKDDLPLFRAATMAEREPDAALPPMPPGQEVVCDYRSLTLSLKAHPISFLRAELARRGATRHADLAGARDGARVAVSGLVLIRQRPGSAKGVIFMTLEDETGIANLIVWPKTFEAFRPVVVGARLVGVRGRLQRANGVVHVVADRLEDWSGLLARLGAQALPEALARADEVKGGSAPDPREKETKREREARFRALVREEPALARDVDRHEAERAVRSRGRGAVAAVMPKGRNFR
ncbi:error-prone DNA polymerase [Salinarimonas sp. NSM]|uniref:error-prone DNA polymerase n=1 Tax=Salinarimonas sp. NSM TaxID=3458003 RepID=UPI0040372F54